MRYGIRFYIEKGGYMELQVGTKDLLDRVNHLFAGWDELDARTQANRMIEAESWKDYVLIASLIGIMERLERLHGAVLSLQK